MFSITVSYAGTTKEESALLEEENAALEEAVRSTPKKYAQKKQPHTSPTNIRPSNRKPTPLKIKPKPMHSPTFPLDEIMAEPQSGFRSEVASASNSSPLPSYEVTVDNAAGNNTRTEESLLKQFQQPSSQRTPIAKPTTARKPTPTQTKLHTPVLSDYDHIKVIGRGAYGEVRLVRRKATGQVYAMKVLSKSNMIAKDQVERIMAERDILALADNPWVVRLYQSFHDSRYLYLVMEYSPGGDMMNLFVNYDVLAEHHMRFYAAEITLAIHSVHELKYMHRDLKPDNVLVDASGHIKLTDFGLCKYFENSELLHYRALSSPTQKVGLSLPARKHILPVLSTRTNLSQDTPSHIHAPSFQNRAPDPTSPPPALPALGPEPNATAESAQVLRTGGGDGLQDSPDPDLPRGLGASSSTGGCALPAHACGSGVDDNFSPPVARLITSPSGPAQTEKQTESLRDSPSSADAVGARANRADSITDLPLPS